MAYPASLCMVLESILRGHILKGHFAFLLPSARVSPHTSLELCLTLSTFNVILRFFQAREAAQMLESLPGEQRALCLISSTS